MASDRWLIVGLGNPGSKYANTRHNIGFKVIHRLGERWNVSAKEERARKAIIGTARFEQHTVTLMQPLTYMNLSGEAVQPFMAYYHIPLEHLLVIYDDVAIPFGTLRLRESGSSGGQNGMKSIIQHLGNRQDFARLRVGIGPREDADKTVDLKDYVLTPFSASEQNDLDTIVNTASLAVEQWIVHGAESAMSRYNGPVTSV